jgi:hypothetical protein
MALSLVSDYLSEARRLLQDKAVPYRYEDNEIVTALNIAIGEAARIRPDMFQDYYGSELPSYTTIDLSALVDIPAAFRMAFLYYIVGYNQLADQEDVTDARSSALLNKFVSQLLTVSS